MHYSVNMGHEKPAIYKNGMCWLDPMNVSTVTNAALVIVTTR